MITYTCSCGHSYTEAIEANGHSFENGVCTDCEAADPNYNPPADETPDENPDETPEENPEETPNETPNEIPDDDNQKPARKTFWQMLADFFRAIGNFFVRLFTGKKN